MISFWEAPWYVLVCFVINGTPTKRFKCVTSINFTINIATDTYQYLFNLFYHNINLLSFIYFCCTLIYRRFVISLCFICNNHEDLIISQILNQFHCDIFKHNIFLQTSESTTFKNIWLTTQSKHWNTEIYWGLANSGERDHDSDIILLDSVIFRQYITVTNQC